MDLGRRSPRWRWIRNDGAHKYGNWSSRGWQRVDITAHFEAETTLRSSAIGNVAVSSRVAVKYVVLSCNGRRLRIFNIQHTQQQHITQHTTTVQVTSVSVSSQGEPCSPSSRSCPQQQFALRSCVVMLLRVLTVEKFYCIQSNQYNLIHPVN